MINFGKTKLIISLMAIVLTNSASAGLFSNKCSNAYGTLRVVEPQDVSAWTGIGLSAPTKILNVFVNDSKCFTIVDRGAAFNAAQLERNLANSGLLQTGQNIGSGQMKAADFVLVPDLISQNLDAGGSNMNLSGSKSGLWGSGSGKASRATRKKSAEVVLTLIDVRTSEQVASVTAKAVIKDSMNVVQLGANVPTAMVNGQVGFSNYSNTPIGSAIQIAYDQAYDRLMSDIKNKNIGQRKYNAPEAVVYQNINQPQQVMQQHDYQAQIPQTQTNQVQNVIVNQQVMPQNFKVHNDGFSQQGMMQQVGQHQQDVAQLQMQAPTIQPVAAVAQQLNSFTAQQPVAVLTNPLNTVVAQQAAQHNQVNQNFNQAPANVDPIVNFLTQFKSANQDGRQLLINNLSSLSASTTGLLRKPSLNKDKIFLSLITQLPNLNPRVRDGFIKNLDKMSDNQIKNLLATYRYLLDTN